MQRLMLLGVALVYVLISASLQAQSLFGADVFQPKSLSPDPQVLDRLFVPFTYQNQMIKNTQEMEAITQRLSAEGLLDALVIEEEGEHSVPRWSHDGRYLSFQTLDSNHCMSISILDLHLGKIRRLRFARPKPQMPEVIPGVMTPPNAPEKFYMYSVAWHPGQNLFVFCGSCEGQDYNLYLADPQSLRLEQITLSKGWEQDPAWVMDEKQRAYLLYSRGNQIFWSSLEGPTRGEEHLLLTSQEHGLPICNNVRSFPLIEDGLLKLVFCGRRAGQNGHDVYLLRAGFPSGEIVELRRLSREEVDLLLPEWSPNGKSVLCFGRHPRYGLRIYHLLPEVRMPGEKILSWPGLILHSAKLEYNTHGPEISADSRWTYYFVMPENQYEEVLLMVRIQATGYVEPNLLPAGEGKKYFAKAMHLVLSPDGTMAAWSFLPGGAERKLALAVLRLPQESETVKEEE